MRWLLLCIAILCFGQALLTFIVQTIALFKDIDLSDKDLSMRYAECLFMGGVCLWMRDDYEKETDEHQQIKK